MKKANVIRSDFFHMDEGDILNMLFLDEIGTPVTITLNSVSVDGTDNRELPPDAPVALDASDVTATSFSANVNLMENTLGFYLDVATDSAFTAFVAGYNDLDIGLVDNYPVVGLDDATTYYYRLRGYNDYGTGDSSNVITTLTDVESVTDGDGNIYSYVTIGSQQWLVENLKTTKYIDGVVIPNLTIDGDWMADITGAYCAYDNDILNIPIYGLLYNHYAVNNIHGLAPTGWRVPTKTDYEALVMYLGGFLVAGGLMKEVDITHWDTPNTGADNSSGLTVLPNGLRNSGDGSFSSIGVNSLNWQSTSEDDPTGGDCMVLSYNSAEASENNWFIKDAGCAVRCMRDVV